LRLTARVSISRRITVLFVGASTTVLMALGFVVGASIERHFEQLDMEVLIGKMELTRHILEQWKNPDDLPRSTHMLANALVGHHGLEVIVLDANRASLFSTMKMKVPIDIITSMARSSPNKPSVWTQGTQTYRIIAATISRTGQSGAREGEHMTVAVALDIAYHHEFMRSFLLTLWVFVAGAAALTGLLGWAATRHGLAPLREMREQTRQVVSAQQLSRRLSVDSAPLELAELAQSLNEMLARLEQAFLRLSDFSSDIAHELRTPVSNLMTQTQVTLSKVRGADEYRGILESNAEEYERMGRMISDMLLLAKDGSGLMVPHRETIELGAELRSLFEYYEALAEEKELRLEVSGKAEVSADKLMLRRAMGNLLSNAVRHAQTNTSIRVHIVADTDTIAVSMENTGGTIAPQYLERVFDRFFRADPSRHRSYEGTGLGLAITKSIVLAHGGSISAASNSGLTTFTIRLPREASMPNRAPPG